MSVFFFGFFYIAGEWGRKGLPGVLRESISARTATRRSTEFWQVPERRFFLADKVKKRKECSIMVVHFTAERNPLIHDSTR